RESCAWISLAWAWVLLYMPLGSRLVNTAGGMHDRLARDRHGAAGHGRYPARSAVRQPLLAGIPAGPLCRGPTGAAGGGAGRTVSAYAAYRRHHRLVLSR